MSSYSSTVGRLFLSAHFINAKLGWLQGVYYFPFFPTVLHFFRFYKFKEGSDEWKICKTMPKTYGGRNLGGEGTGNKGNLPCQKNWWRNMWGRQRWPAQSLGSHASLLQHEMTTSLIWQEIGLAARGVLPVPMLPKSRGGKWMDLFVLE